MDTDSPLEFNDIHFLIVLNNVFSSLSLIGCVLILIFFTRTWRLWTYSGKMIMCVIFANLLYAFTNLLSLADSDFYTICDIDGFLRTFSTLSSFFWATRICLIAFRALVSEYYDPNQPTRYLMGFLGPFIVAIIPVFNFNILNYENLGLSCDLNANDEGWRAAWISVLLLLPMIGCMILTTYYSVKIIKMLSGYESGLGVQTKHFIAHPIGLLVAWFPSIVFRIAFLCGYYAVWLDAISIVFSRSSGLINALIYGWQSYRASQKKKEEEIMATEAEESLMYRYSIQNESQLDDSFVNDMMKKSKSLMIF